MKRREFLRAVAAMAAGVAVSACAQPTAQIIEKQVPVEKIVKETVVVEKEVAVEKIVKETVLVQKEVAVEKIVTATPIPSKYKEAPMLAELVKAGKLPPVDERVGEEPMVITPWEEIGQYGGTWHRLAAGPNDVMMSTRINYSQMIRWDKDGAELIPNVVTGWEANGDTSEFTFSLRKGMKWSDGHPYTTDDLAFNFEDRLTNKDLVPTVSTYWMRGGERVKFTKIDDTHFKYSFKAAYPLFIYYLAGSKLPMDHRFPKHYLQQFHPKYTAQATLDKKAKDAGFEFWYQLFGNKGGDVGILTNVDLPVLGAWKVTAPSPAQPVVFERNPYYWKVDTAGNQLPYLDRVEHAIVQDAAQANLRAIAGEVDMQFRHMTFDNYPLFQENKEKGDYRVLEWPLGGITGNAFYFNYEHKDTVLRDIFRDKRFRYACSLGLNRQEIIDGVFLGVGAPTTVCPPPESPFYWEEYATWLTEHDPARANAYLDEMGLTKRDSDGYRLRPDGKRLAFAFEYVPTLYNFRAQAELFVPAWKELGIELILKEYDRTLWNEKAAAAEFDMATWATGTTYNPIIRRDWFACKILGAVYFGYWTWWTSGGKQGVEPPAELRIKELYELDTQFEATSDMEEWKKIIRKMLEIQKDQMHFIAVSTSAPEIVIVKNKFRNVPDKAMSDLEQQAPGACMPEQFFIKQ